MRDVVWVSRGIVVCQGDCTGTLSLIAETSTFGLTQGNRVSDSRDMFASSFVNGIQP